MEVDRCCNGYDITILISPYNGFRVHCKGCKREICTNISLEETILRWNSRAVSEPVKVYTSQTCLICGYQTKDMNKTMCPICDTLTLAKGE